MNQFNDSYLFLVKLDICKTKTVESNFTFSTKVEIKMLKSFEQAPQKCGDKMLEFNQAYMEQTPQTWG